MMERYIMKEELFNEAKLQMNFLKFTGYKSKMDI